MNSTDFSVRRNMPVADRIRSRGTSTWMPLDASTFSPPDASARFCVSSVHTPVAPMTWRALIVDSAPLSLSRTTAPVTRPEASFVSRTTDTRDAASAPLATAVRTRVMTRRASSTRASW